MTVQRIVPPALHIAAIALLSVALLPITSMPLHWDELRYMGLAYQPEPDPEVLNRYGHVYLLSAFMWIVGEPYFAARLMWSVLMAITLSATFIATAALKPTTRCFAVALTALLLLGQDTISWYLGIAYVDFTMMCITSVSVALVLPQVMRGEAVAGWRCVLLGFLFAFSLRVKEPCLALGALVATVLLQPSTATRPVVAGFRNLGLYLLGALVAASAQLGVDAMVLGDWLFGWRPENWNRLLKFNDIGLTTYTSPYSWLSWMVRPENYTATLLYLATLIPVQMLLRDLRATAIWLLPIGYLAVFLGSFVTGNSVVVPRYSIVFLPLMSLLASISACVLIEQAFTNSRVRQVVFLLLSVTIAMQLAVIVFVVEAAPNPLPSLLNGPIAQFARLRDLQERFLHELVLPVALFGGLAFAAIAVSGVRWLRPPVALLLVLMVLASAVRPAIRVTQAIVNLEIRNLGERRFVGLRELLNSIPTSIRTGNFAVAGGLYEGQIAERAYLAREIFSLGSRRRLREDQVAVVRADMANEPISTFVKYEYLVSQGDAAEALMAHLTSSGAFRPDDVKMRLSSDGTVALFHLLAEPAVTAITTQPSTTRSSVP